MGAVDSRVRARDTTPPSQRRDGTIASGQHTIRRSVSNGGRPQPTIDTEASCSPDARCRVDHDHTSMRPRRHSDRSSSHQRQSAQVSCLTTGLGRFRWVVEQRLPVCVNGPRSHGFRSNSPVHTTYQSPDNTRAQKGPPVACKRAIPSSAQTEDLDAHRRANSSRAAAQQPKRVSRRDHETVTLVGSNQRNARVTITGAAEVHRGTTHPQLRHESTGEPARTLRASPNDTATDRQQPPQENRRGHHATPHRRAQQPPPNNQPPPTNVPKTTLAHAVVRAAHIHWASASKTRQQTRRPHFTNKHSIRGESEHNLQRVAQRFNDDAQHPRMPCWDGDERARCRHSVIDLKAPTPRRNATL